MCPRCKSLKVQRSGPGVVYMCCTCGRHFDTDSRRYSSVQKVQTIGDVARNPFKVIRSSTPKVTGCPRGYECGWTDQPMLRNVPLSELPR